MPDALKKADEVLQQAVQGITDLINLPALINLDFADVQTVMKDKGMAHIGIGSAQGDDKAIEAVKLAVASPLLETKINGATHVIINISGDISLMDANDAASYVQDLAGENANIIFGAKFDESMTDQASITVIATGLEDVSEKIDMPGKQAAPGAGMAGGMQTVWYIRIRQLQDLFQAWEHNPQPQQDFTQQQQADFIQLPSHSRQHLHMHIQVSRSHASLRARLSL